MGNTQPAHFENNGLPPQSSATVGATTLRRVGQDKPRSPRARTASPQPAPLQKDMRPQQMNRNTSRSQNRPTPKRKTVHLTLWVKPVVKTELQRRAEREGVSVSATGGAFLEQALQQHVDMHYGALLQPIIEQAIRKQMRGMSTRLAWLLVRVAFDSGQTRSLVTNILGRQSGVTPDVLKSILDGSSKTAKGNITRRTPQLTELLDAVEHWMVAEEGGQQTNA
jgi:hypothetical protein